MIANDLAILILATYIFILVVYILVALWQEFLRTKNFHFLLLGSGFMSTALGMIIKITFILSSDFLILNSVYRASGIPLSFSLALVLWLILFNKGANWLWVGLLSTANLLILFAWPLVAADSFESIRLSVSIALALAIIVTTLAIYFRFKQRSVLYFLAAILIMALSPVVSRLAISDRFFETVFFSSLAVSIMLLALGIGRFKSKTNREKEESIFGTFKVTVQSIGSKITIGFLISSFVPLLITSYISYNATSNIISEVVLSELELDVRTHAKEISLVMNSYKDSIIFMSHLPQIQGIIRAIDNQGVDPVGEITYEQWKDQLAIIFEEIAKTNSAYMQLRYLDENGQELVRVDNDGLTVKRISQDKLQNKANRYYFTETISLSKDSLYVSALDLNKEGSPPTIEVPYKPVVRYAKPILDDQNSKRGIVIVNIYADQLLQSFHSISGIAKDLEQEKEVELMIDKEGYYIINIDESKRWGGPNNLNSGENFKNDYSKEMAAIVLSGEAGVADMSQHGHVLAFQPIYPDKNNKKDYYIVIEIVPREIVMASVLSLRNTLLLVSLGFILIVIVLAYFISRSITAPVRKLQHGVEIIEKGNLDHKVGTKAKDEVGQLSRAFDKMTAAIKKSRADINRQVMQQTKEITQKAKDLADQQKAVLNVLEDVDEEKQKATQERDKIDAILHSIGDGVFVVDRDLIITIYNEVAAQISYFPIAEALGKRYDQVLKFVYEDDQKIINDKFIKEAIATGHVQEMANHTILIRKNGEKVPVADSAAPIKDKDGQVVGCVVVFRDVTQEREIDKAKTEFVSLASHQLRTPLSTINWYAEMLMAGDAGKMNEDQEKYIKEIYKGNQRMVELVNALLNVSRIELGTLSVEPEMTDLKELAEDMLKEVEHNITLKKLTVDKTYDETLPKVNIDPKLMRIVFQNLLTNAIKYTPEKGKISLEISLQKAGADIKGKIKEDSLQIKVADNGYGIPKRQHNKIFTKLFRADNVREKDTEGTGLGLYIVKSIIDHARGRIWFESEENNGTIFYIIMPLKGMEPKKGTKSLESIKK